MILDLLLRAKRAVTDAGERGISFIWVAVVFLFLTASAALAIDTSGAFGTARTDQNTADLACLAGVDELPDQTAAINIAVAYIDANWPEMAGSTLTLTLPTATYDAGDGNSVLLDARYGGDDDTMYLRITEVNDATFARTIGHDTITVVQQAACQVQNVRTGIGMLPIGALAGSWGGDLFDCAAKVTGNCAALSPHRSGASAYRDAVVEGIEGDFIKHHGNANLADPETGYAAIDCLASPCNVSETEPGNMSGPWRKALKTRFSEAGGTCDPYNCDTINQVFGTGSLGTGLQPLSAVTPGDLVTTWHDSLYGAFAAAQAATNPSAKHWYYNDDQMDCDNPRLATVPIVNSSLNWALGNAAGTWPNGRKDMKFIGFYTVYLREPNTAAEIANETGPMEADIVWFGPDAECNTGEAFQPFGAGVPVDASVKLVAP
ncbi:MAG: pilus assembly protein TadG-related protein [Acidimicrobiia bacterium]